MGLLEHQEKIDVNGDKHITFYAWHLHRGMRIDTQMHSTYGTTQRDKII